LWWTTSSSIWARLKTAAASQSRRRIRSGHCGGGERFPGPGGSGLGPCQHHGQPDDQPDAGEQTNINLLSLTLANAAGEVHDFSNSAEYTWTIAKTTTGVIGFDPAAFNLNGLSFSNAWGRGISRSSWPTRATTSC